MHPNVGAVVVHEDRDIAHDANRALGAVPPQGLPLLVEGELQGAADLQIGRQFLARVLHAPQVRGAPILPAIRSNWPAFVGHARHRTKRNHRATRHSPSRTAQSAAARLRSGRYKAAPGLEQQRHFRGENLIVLNRTPQSEESEGRAWSRSIQPWSTSRSRLISNGLPANAEVEEYGELPYPSGPSGSTCQSPCRADARESMNW